MASRNARRTFSELGTAWLIENGLIWGIAMLIVHFEQYLLVSSGVMCNAPSANSGLLCTPGSEWSFERMLLHTSFGGLILHVMMFDAVMVVQNFLIEVVYSNIPYFEENPRKLPSTTLDIWEAIGEWAQMNGAGALVMSAGFTWYTAQLDQATLNAVWEYLMKPDKINIAAFLLKYAIVRV
jgi:hypothetical protein